MPRENRGLKAGPETSRGKIRTSAVAFCLASEWIDKQASFPADWVPAECSGSMIGYGIASDIGGN